MAQSVARRRYNRRILLLGAIYVLFLFAASYAISHRLIQGPLAYVAATLPALAIVGMFVAIGRYVIDEQDEYVRMLMVRKMLWATGFALSIATVWGFLESFGLVFHVDAYAVMILWFAGLGLGTGMNKLMLGDSGGC